MAKHNIRADMKAEGESLKKERGEPPAEDTGEAKKKGQFSLSRKVPFMSVPGSDPSSAMKGDNAQFVKGSTAPHTKPQKPMKTGSRGYVAQSQFALPRGGKRKT